MTSLQREAFLRTKIDATDEEIQQMTPAEMREFLLQLKKDAAIGWVKLAAILFSVSFILGLIFAFISYMIISTPIG